MFGDQVQTCVIIYPSIKENNVWGENQSTWLLMNSQAARLQLHNNHNSFTATIKVQHVLKKVKNQHSQLIQLTINFCWPARIPSYLWLANVKYLSEGCNWRETYFKGSKYTQSGQLLPCFVNTFLKINFVTTKASKPPRTHYGALSVIVSGWPLKRINGLTCLPPQDMSGFRPKVISLNKKPEQTFGFYLRLEHGEEGHLIRCLELGGPAELAGMKDGDRIVRVNGTFVDQMSHTQVRHNSSSLYVWGFIVSELAAREGGVVLFWL